MVAAERETQWISVEDALPENGQLVHTKIESKIMGTWCLIFRQYINGSWLDFGPDGYAQWGHHPPTHWTPLFPKIL